MTARNEVVTRGPAAPAARVPAEVAGPARAALGRIGGRVAVVGSANADLTVRVAEIPGPGETVAGGDLVIRPGGKSANQAAAAARLGARAVFLGAVGDDPNGEILAGALREAGVDLSRMETAEAATGTALITVSDAGENCIVISPGANARVTPDFVAGRADAIAGAGALGLCLEVEVDAVLAAARAARAAGVPVVFNLSPIREIPDELLDLVDVLIVNEHELARAIGAEAAAAAVDGGAWAEAAEALATGHGIAHAVVTLGGAGSVVLGTGAAGAEASVTPIPAVPVEVVDTTGCGDAYMGTLLAGLASGVELAHAARLASVVGAYAAGGAGAQASYGDVHDLVAFLDAATAG
ncbi:ribokinase [Corynebacterium sphenisci]|uniref:ribokinase n=1 Tax=Corynebacterium sphenisci TaxID=191493 RepID=UPI0026E0041B|nr:ribokinase [Corynebacterium sphenisci]MDO5731395.1 ribokinase [Corynebacterium sphenisci]